MPTLYRLSPEFYSSNNYKPDTESVARIQALGVKVKEAMLPSTLINYCRKQGYKQKLVAYELYTAYWTDSDENVYRII